MKKNALKNIIPILLLIFVITFTGCAGTGSKETESSTAKETETSSAMETTGGNEADADAVDYSITDNWAYYGIGDDKDADLFLICPTVDMNDEWNMPLDDDETMASFLGALNMERGIYEDSARLFAPYYRQAAMKVYELDASDREPYFETAYEDVSSAFEYYLENENDGRPIILAGFSQGADMCYRLMEEYFADAKLSEQLVAAYAIGWPLTEEMTQKYPQLVAASCESDTGVIVSFECESESVSDSMIVPAGVKMLSINPLNWKTDGTAASKEENIGACFTDYDGNITNEVVGLCGGYLDETRGTLKVTDVDAADYPAIVPGLPEGAYHVYDYQFFFRNLQENVKVRLASYLQSR